jgi:tRNA A-37 threonylcarbamoyl transferase component Bud32
MDPLSNPHRVHPFLLIGLYEAEEIFKKLDPGFRVFHIDIVTTGNSTSNYVAETDMGRFFLKLYPETNSLCGNELAAYRYASGLIRAPKVLWSEYRPGGVSHAILEYIEGAMTLEEYVRENKTFSEDVAFQIGAMLSLLHSRSYPGRGRLDKNLELSEPLPTLCGQILSYLDGTAGEWLGEACRERLRAFFNDHKDALDEEAGSPVFSHGDFIPNNVLVDDNKTVWFIDFERCTANPRYCDIGKLFRPRPEYTCYIGAKAYAAFRDGYNRNSPAPLPENWRLLSSVLSIENQLSHLNRAPTKPPRAERMAEFLPHVVDAYLRGEVFDITFPRNRAYPLDRDR